MKSLNSDQANQFTSDTTAIEKYLTQNNISATKNPAGVWYIVDTASQGFRATFSDSIKIKYKIRLLKDNSIVDEATTPTVMPLSASTTLTGLILAISQFQKGSYGRLFIPSYYGYGTSTHGTIPANSNLIFEFKLEDVMDYQLRKDTALIGSYLKENNLSANIDPSGVRYTITTLGPGDKPASTDSIKVIYSAKLLTNGQIGETIDQSTKPVEFLLSDLILGWQIVLPEISEGSTVTLYVPSSLGYGHSVNKVVPANSILICPIQITKVKHL